MRTPVPRAAAGAAVRNLDESEILVRNDVKKDTTGRAIPP
jgi:hypothetical protein